MELSEKQLAANRANAAKSTGPKTIGGKYNSSRNATTHGFLAASILLPGESRERFLELYSSLVNEFEPATPTEHMLVETMAVTRWRILRGWTLETANLIHEQRLQSESTGEENPPTRTILAVRSLSAPPRSQESLSRFEVRYDRQYHRAVDRLLRLRAQKEEDLKRSRQPEENKGKPELASPKRSLSERRSKPG